MSGILTLVPTPIEELGVINKRSFDLLNEACMNFDSNILVVEDAKPARRRWLSWGLPREAVEKFVYFNEHGQKKLTDSILCSLKEGKNVYLMSDGGMPAFCDPGRELVWRCHQSKIKVTCASIDNSLIAAVALSGMTEGPFSFKGFPPRDKEERQAFFQGLCRSHEVVAFMDTPYRLERVASEIKELGSGEVCFVMDIARETEQVIYSSVKQLKDWKWGKREFVCIYRSLTC